MESTLTKLQFSHTCLDLLLSDNFPPTKESATINEINWLIHDTGILECSAVAEKSHLNEKNVKKAYIISAGIHGNETAPIEILNDIINKLIKAETRLVHPTLFIFGNIEGMKKSVREIEYNLNRLFSGRHQKIAPCYETQRAELFERVCSEFRNKYSDHDLIHFDLHTAIKESAHEKFAIYPFVEKRELNTEVLDNLESMGIEAILFSNKKATTFSHYTSEFLRACGITVELGKVHPFGQNPQESFVACKQTLIELIADKKPTMKNKKAIAYNVKCEIIKKSEDFKFNFDKNTKNFTRFDKGTHLYTEGEQQWHTDEDGLRIVFPNEKVAIGERTGLLVKEVLVDRN